MTTKPFAPKDAETLKTEILTNLGIDYEGNEEHVDKMVARELESEEFKASLHGQKEKHLKDKEALKKRLMDAGLDPETGEKLGTINSGEQTPKDDLSFKDIRALADVHDEDVEDVLEFAKFKGISVAEAKTHSVVKTLLQTKAEERATALAANTASNKRGSSVDSEDVLLRKVSNQEEMSDEEMQLAAKAEIARMRAQ
jgi:hypothetical protein